MLLKNETMGANQTASNPLATGLVLNNDNLIATNQLNEEMRKTANELLDSMQDSRFSETEVLLFNLFVLHIFCLFISDFLKVIFTVISRYLKNNNYINIWLRSKLK